MKHSCSVVVHLLLLLVLYLAVPAATHADLINNGGFETGTNPPPTGQIRVVSTQSQLDNWAVTASIEWIHTAYWQSHSGNYSIDLNATFPGIISQTFATEIGTQYRVDFWLAGNYGSTVDKQVNVSCCQ